MFSIYNLHDMIEQATLAYPQLKSQELEQPKNDSNEKPEKAIDIQQTALHIPANKEDSARLIAYELGWDYNNLTEDQLAIVVASL